MNLRIADREGHEAVGKLPEGVELSLVPRDGALPSAALAAEFVVPSARDARVLEALPRMQALRVLLQAGRIRAAVDVTDPEPLPPGHPLWDAPGLLATPHLAGDTEAADRRAYALVGEQVRRYVRGEPLANKVEHGY